MKQMYVTGIASLLAMATFAKKGGNDGAAVEDVAEDVGEEKASNSIVPRNWKSKNDALKQFIDEQASGKEGFEFPAFFALMRKNGVPEEQVAKYESQVAEKRPGANGRAVMTLRNILVPIIRKTGKVVALNGDEIEMDIPKPKPSGAAAKAKEDAAA